MEEMIVKSEQSGEILLFYVDENGGNEQGVVTTIQNIEEGELEDPQEIYTIEEVNDNINENEQQQQHEYEASKEKWIDGEIKRLLIFYIDNKETFLSGVTRKKHLWTVACKTMLTNKTPTACDMKIRNLKRKYSLIHVEELTKRGNGSTWPYYDLCNQAFHDDSSVKALITEELKQLEPRVMKVPAPNTEGDGVVVIRKVNSKSTPDRKVEEMLKLYLKHKKQTPKEYWQKHIWEKIAIELGEDSEYWHKRFLNYKNHYIQILEKRNEPGQKISWPYMKLFDEIFEDDVDFKRKYTPRTPKPIELQCTIQNDYQIKPTEWDETEKTVLVKYCFDCFDEFQDPTIPKSFLWNEVERLLDKPRDTCKSKCEEMRSEHLSLYIAGGYKLHNRKPISILLDNLISKEIELQLTNAPKRLDQLVSWHTDLIDELVQFFLDNIELFKDPISHFVCWAAVSKKLSRIVSSCRDQWRDLTALYKSILEDKKENPDMQIDWRYTDLFDRIFDYGMDTKLLEGYEKEVDSIEKDGPRRIGVKKPKFKLDEEFSENGSDIEEYDERGLVKRSRGTGDAKQIKILEYYLKNKDKFSKSQQKKNTLWEVLGKQIGITSEQCAHRFRNLKQVYTAYIKREITKPEMPILWPYYALCKKVFGYRAIKNKLKNGSLDSDDGKEWSTKEIKQLIDYFSKNFDVLNNNTDDTTYWASLSYAIGKSETLCRDKFLELRKSYRKIKTMKTRNAKCNVNWKYFKTFEEIFGKNEVPGKLEDVEEQEMDVDLPLELPLPDDAVKTELHDDEYQCIIVIPEGEDMSNLQNAQIIIKDPAKPTENKQPKKIKWTKESKKMLLQHYLDYVESHINESIKTALLWKELAKKMPGTTPLLCKKKYHSLRCNYWKQKKIKNSPYDSLFKKIKALNARYWRNPTYEEVVLENIKTFKDISLPEWKVEKALQYYLQHIEEFLNPKYEKKYAWLELAKHVSIPLVKVYTKINYLKQFFNSETNEVAGVKVEFGDLIKEILEKEFVVRIAMEMEPQPMAIEETTEVMYTWSEEEIELLLKWYLENLDKFKNQKFVTSYLWMEASILLNKSALECSKKMSEIRTLYSTMVKETPEALNSWRYHELCQKIYGTGKKGTPVNSD